jgi:methylenetetrahydrofolate reductase (NADPH)
VPEATTGTHRPAAVPIVEVAELRRRISDLAALASIEITATSARLVPEVAACLLPATVVYVAHPPKAALADVVSTAVRVQQSGLRACPHLVARRIESRRALEHACQQLSEAGVDRALAVAGDIGRPVGEFASSLEVLRTGVLPHYGLRLVGVAGHPEGHRAIGQSVLWRSLLEKQALAKRQLIEMHIVTQFGFDPAALLTWAGCLPEHGVDLPVHVGMSGPASLPQLINYAMQCGVAASLRGTLQSMNAMRNVAGLATSPDQMLAHVARHAEARRSQLEAVHFYSFGGAVGTARWVRAVAEGHFELDADGQGFRVLDQGP